MESSQGATVYHFAHCSEAGFAEYPCTSLERHWMEGYIRITQQLIFLRVIGRCGDCLHRFPRMAFESEIKEE